VQTPSALVALLEPWAETYGNSPVLPTLIVFGHIAGLMLAGGMAIALDRGTLRAGASSHEERQRHLAEMGAGHRWVMAGLALSAVSGVLLFTADIETYFVSTVFWVKLTLIAGLLVNGFAMTRTESRLRGSPDIGGWTQLRTRAVTSLVLWFAIALAGVALVNT
jgi:hypothetical protein